MAVYPCSIVPHRYAQKQRAIYISDVGSARPETRKHRACPRHFEEKVAYLASNFTLIEEDSQMSMECELCQKPREGGIFVKVYAEDGFEPAQYAADLCALHRQQVLEDLGWRNALSVGRSEP